MSVAPRSGVWWCHCHRGSSGVGHGHGVPPSASQVVAVVDPPGHQHHHHHDQDRSPGGSPDDVGAGVGGGADEEDGDRGQHGQGRRPDVADDRAHAAHLRRHEQRTIHLPERIGGPLHHVHHGSGGSGERQRHRQDGGHGHSGRRGFGQGGDARAPQGEGHQRRGRSGEVVEEQAAAVDRERGGQVGLIEGLGQGFSGLQAEHEQGQAGADQGRGDPAGGRHQADGGHGGHDEHPEQARGREPDQAVPGTPPGRRPRSHPRHPDPGPGPGLLLAELSAQQHDGAQVLHGDGETKLGHETAPSDHRLQRGTTHQRQADGGETCRGHHDHEVGGGLLERPEGQVPGCIGWSGNVAARCHGGHLPAQQQQSDQGDGRSGKPGGVAQQRRAHVEQAGDHAEHRTPPGPCRQRTRQASAGELTDDGPGDPSDEGERPYPLDRGREQRRAPPDGSQQEVVGIGALDGQRSTVRAAAQPPGHGQRDHDAEHLRTVLLHVGDAGGVEGLIGDEAGDEQDGAASEERRDVDAVQRFEPLDLTQPVPPPSGSEVTKRGAAFVVTCARGGQGRHRRGTLLPVAPGGRSMGIRRPAGPTGHVEPRRGQSGVFHGQHVEAGRHS
jgi:hypothetical protein